MTPHQATFPDNRGVRWTWDELQDLEKCPACEGSLDHGTFIPTMTSNYECAEDNADFNEEGDIIGNECGWNIEYPYHRPEDVE